MQRISGEQVPCLPAAEHGSSPSDQSHRYKPTHTGRRQARCGHSHRAQSPDLTIDPPLVTILCHPVSFRNHWRCRRCDLSTLALRNICTADSIILLFIICDRRDLRAVYYPVHRDRMPPRTSQWQACPPGNSSEFRGLDQSCQNAIP